MSDRNQLVCLCKKVSLGVIQDLISENPKITVEEIKAKTGAGTGCSRCVDGSKGRALHLEGLIENQGKI